MDARELLYWRAYERIEPFLEERLNYHFAALALIVVNVAGGKRRDGREFSLQDMLLDFASPYVEAERVGQQSLKDIERHIAMWVAASNASLAEKGA